MKTCPVCDKEYPDQHTNCPSDGAVLIVSHELTAGSLVRGKYRIVSKLGQGGMATVYLAEHILLGGHVALKFLAAELSHNPQFIKRFRMEARAAYQLRHPNIVEVLDLDQAEDGSLFIAMEYVAGKSLREVIEEAPGGLAIPQALEMTRGIVSGLAAAHAQGTVHRDIKPENVLLVHTADGRELPKVLDFGIAAMAESAIQTHMTRGLLLTPGYAAPEQWMEMPASEMDGRTDLYAVGCVFYEMLTGHTPFPFQAHNMENCRRQHLEETPRLPSELRPELAEWTGLDGLVMRVLAKNRNDRPQDAELLNLLDAVQFAPGQRRSKTVAGFSLERPKAISKDGWVRQEPDAAPVSPEPKPGSSITELSALPVPTGFFTKSIFSRIQIPGGGQFRYDKTDESFIFYRNKLTDEYDSLSNQVKITFYLWITSVVLGLAALVSGTILLFLKQFTAGSVSAISTIFVYFIQKVFQQREDHYRGLAEAKLKFLEYGNRWLEAIQIINEIENPIEKERRKGKLVKAVTSMLAASQPHKQQPSGTLSPKEKKRHQ